jgi:2-iminobutanoate/2-iminopropanoate deaminase
VDLPDWHTKVFGGEKMKTKVEAAGAPKATGPFSQAIVSGNLVFTSGQIYLNAEGKLVEGSIEEQAHQVMKNLKAVLEQAGVSFREVVKTTIYVTDMSVYGKINEVYGGYMAEPFPARETVCVKELPLGARLEISMVAVKG